MSAKLRQQQFDKALRGHASIRSGAALQQAYGMSNGPIVHSAEVLLCGTANFETRTGTPDQSQAVLQTRLRFPPGDEVYFATVIDDAGTLNQALEQLAVVARAANQERIASGKPEGGINNNVRLYLRPDGKVRLKNEYLKDDEALAVIEEAPAVQVAAMVFAVWPPAASQRRSALIREFAEYLGRFVGDQNVHELKVWQGEAELPSEMRRLPKDLDINEIVQSVDKLGGHYPHREIQRLHAALNFHPSKHFVILSGVSGTGKTQLAIQYAKAVHGIVDRREKDRLLVVSPVRPDWTDPTGLTGHFDVLSQRYVVPPFLEAILLADMHPESPVFVILDELNLARVEYYLSDVLSAMETEEQLQLHDSESPLESEAGYKIKKHQRVPENLYIIGTINVDETTNPISDKVLDRAVVIEMSRVDLKGYVEGRLKTDPVLQASADYCWPHLEKIVTALQREGSGFGYRVVKEVIQYHAFAVAKAGATVEHALDELLIQKVLTKLRGSQRHGQMLDELLAILASFANSKAFVERLARDLSDYGSFQASR